MSILNDKLISKIVTEICATEEYSAILSNVRKYKRTIKTIPFDEIKKTINGTSVFLKGKHKGFLSQLGVQNKTKLTSENIAFFLQGSLSYSKDEFAFCDVFSMVRNYSPVQLTLEDVRLLSFRIENGIVDFLFFDE